MEGQQDEKFGQDGSSPQCMPPQDGSTPAAHGCKQQLHGDTISASGLKASFIQAPYASRTCKPQLQEVNLSKSSSPVSILQVHRSKAPPLACTHAFCSPDYQGLNAKFPKSQTEESFPNIQSKPPLVQLETSSSYPIPCYLGEETDPHLSTPSFQGVVESDKVSPQPPFLQAKQPQVPQPLLIGLVLQTLHQLCCPSLDTLQPLTVSLGVRGPTLNTAFEVRPHQGRVQGHDHCPSPAGRTIADTSQDAVGLLGHLGALLAHIQAAVDQHPQVLFRWAAFQPLFPKPVVLHGVAVAQVQKEQQTEQGDGPKLSDQTDQHRENIGIKMLRAEPVLQRNPYKCEVTPGIRHLAPHHAT
ncbi:hypothetical protein QYF61_009247 [Mycteria americana]|uniref:Uncharacterized protein n=1 Tax=Mycteria americana TaxID=33587 RepID=A0AAN7MX88_MYCAM|nr:hypothetical protein QYF61_009247 [Mycteria americana]